MKFWFLVVMLLCSPVLFAQNAKVIQLSPEDVKDAKGAYEEMKAAEKKWEDIQAKMKNTYKGFDWGFEFSSDFKFIVPVQTPTYNTATIWPNYCTLVPASTATTTCGNCIRIQ